MAAVDAVDRLDEAMTIVSARSAFALGALLVLIVIALLWAFFGTIPVTVTGRGVFVSGEGVVRVASSDDATILEVDVAPGVTVRGGDVIARERNTLGTVVALRAPRAGTVIELVQDAGAVVRRGDAVVSIATSGQKLRAIVFVPVASDRHVERGMTARVAPVDIAATSGRAVRASVAAVAPYPASADRIRRALQDDALAAQFPATLPVREVQLELATTAAGVPIWSGTNAPVAPPAGGTPCTATILVRGEHPIDLVFSRS